MMGGIKSIDKLIMMGENEETGDKTAEASASPKNRVRFENSGIESVQQLPSIDDTTTSHQNSPTTVNVSARISSGRKRVTSKNHTLLNVEEIQSEKSLVHIASI